MTIPLKQFIHAIGTYAIAVAILLLGFVRVEPSQKHEGTVASICGRTAVAGTVEGESLSEFNEFAWGVWLRTSGRLSDVCPTYSL